MSRRSRASEQRHGCVGVIDGRCGVALSVGAMREGEPQQEVVTGGARLSSRFLGPAVGLCPAACEAVATAQQAKAAGTRGRITVRASLRQGLSGIGPRLGVSWRADEC